MILVTGATGNYGKQVINFLLKKGIPLNNISALVRDKAKAEDLINKGITIKIGDYNNPDTLIDAFRDIDQLLFTSSSELENRTVQHINVLEAAKTAGVNHIIYTSFVRKIETDNSPISFLQDTHIATEKWLKENNINYTILQNALYLDLLPVFLDPKIKESGLIYLPAKEGKTGSVLREELAEAAANILTTTGHKNKTYLLSNSETFNYTNIAIELGKIINTEIKYISPEVKEFKEKLTTMGVPEEYIGLQASFSEAQANGEFDTNDNTLEELLGRKPTTLSQYLAKEYAQ